MCLSLCVYIRCMFVPFWKVIPKFGIPGFIKIFNVLNAFRDFSLEPYSNVLVYHTMYMDYDDRLANLGLQSLEYRRVFYNLVMCYKIYNNLDDLPFESFFTKPAIGLIPSEVILVSCDPNIYPIMHSERIFSLNV